MCRAPLLAVLALGLAACGASAASRSGPPMRIEFGIAGGNMVPYTVTISPSGTVHVSGSYKVGNKHLSPADVRKLSRDVRLAFQRGLTSRQCGNTLPDVGSDFIRAGGRSARVHGNCEPRFQRLWNELLGAVEFRLG